MNPGETRPWETDDGELGEALQDRLSRLAARLERLTSDPRALTRTVGEPLADAQMASEAFAEDYPEHRPTRRRDPAPSYNTANERTQRGPAKQEKAGLAEIAAALRDIERREPPAAAPESRPASRDHVGAEKRLQSIRQRIDALKSRHGDDAKPSRSRPAEPEQAELPAFETPRPERAPYSRAAEFNAAIAEIAARQRDIDGDVSPPITTRRPEETPPAPTRSPDRRLSDSVSDLRNRVEELSRESLPHAPERALDAAPRRTEAPQTPLAFATLEQQLASIQRQLDASPRVQDVTAIAAGNEAILERIDGLLSRSPENGFESFAQQIIHRVPSSDRFDALIAEVDRLSERINNIGGRDDLARIEARMMGLYEQLASNNPAARVESEIASVRDAVDRLSGMLGENSNSALDRLEERLGQIAERLDTTLAAAPRPEDTADLFKRLETMARRGEAAPEALEALASEIAGLRARERSELANLDNHIQALAKRLDEAILGQASGEVAIAELDGKLGALSARLDDLAEAAPSAERLAALDQVDEQVRQLADRLDQIATTDQSSEAMADLEAQVAVLMERLERLSADHQALQDVQANLARVETLVSSADVNSMQAIQRAAREAVNELSGVAGGPDARIVEELRADLHELQKAAESKEQQTSGTLDTVHKTLDRVVARLGSLEEDVRGPGSERVAERAPAAPLPATEPSQPLRRRADRQDPDDQPLAPGSNRLRPNEKPSSDRDRRADFIAAARRAAQAAAAEHGAIQQTIPSEEADGEDAAGGGSRLRRAISNNRRPLLLAAAAIVLAIAAFQIAKPFFGSSNEAPAPQSQTLENDAAVIEPAPVVEPPVADETPVVVIAPPEEAEAPPASPVAEAPAPAASPAAAPAFMPPAGVTSPINAPAAAEAPAADTTAYAMPEEAIGGVRLRVAAAEGDPAALYEVGARYADGNGVTRDLAEAAVWLERAAEAGLAVAQHRLAAMYEAGLGVDENRPMALQWYTAAADQGNVLAMHNIGVMHSQGIEGTPDFASAVEWFTLAADHGIRDSQYNLGVIYARGIGVDTDFLAAYKWFALAAAQGDSDAAARRDEVAATLTPEDLATARASVSAWTVETAPASANTVDVPEGGWDAPEERAEITDRDALVRTIQALLADRGYDPGPADGVIGPMTRDAARAFQQAIGVPVTGELDETLLDALTEQAA